MATHEFTLIGKNAKNETGEAHIEYTSHAPDPQTAAHEVATELQKALGKEHVRIISEDA